MMVYLGKNTMAKAQTFADKVNKARMAGVKICDTCGETHSYLKKVEPVKKDNWKFGFNETIIRYCKCNANEVMGA